MRRVLVISEGSPGHDAQTRGLVDELSARYPELEVATLCIMQRLGGLLRIIGRQLMGRSGHNLPKSIQQLFVKLDAAAVKSLVAPDVVISSGGQSVFAALHMARRFGAPYIYIGERKPYPSEWFHTVFTPSPLEQGVNDFAIDLIPTGVTPKKVEAAAYTYDRPEGKLWAMVIGGESRSHKYSEQDWVELAHGMNALALEYDIRWLLTTSRRTGARAEALLKEHIDPEYLADSVWWSEAPRKIMLAFFGAAERVFVTQDSVTMVSECVASGKVVTVVAPGYVLLKCTSFVSGYLQRLDSSDIVSRLKIDGFSSQSYQTLPSLAPLIPVELRMVDHLLKRLR